MKYAVTILFMLCGALAFSQTYTEYKAIADSLYTQKKYDELIDYFKARSRSGENGDGFDRWIALGYMGKSDFRQSEIYYLKALEDNDTCSSCLANMAQIKFIKKDLNKASEYINRAISTNPDKATYFALRASLKASKGDELGAITDYNKAIDMAPENGFLYLQRGNHYSLIGMDLLALSDYDDAIRYSPENFAPYLWRSGIYLKQQEFDKALVDVNRAISLDSNQAGAYNTRGTVYMHLNDGENAMIDFNRALETDSNLYLAYLNRSRLHYQLEDIDGACKDIFKARELHDQGVFEDQSAMSYVDQVIAGYCDTSRSGYFYQRGIAYYNLGEFQRSVDIYQAGLKKFPDNVLLLSFAGNAYLALGAYEKAVSYYYLAMKNPEQLDHDLANTAQYSNVTPEALNALKKGIAAENYKNLAACKLYMNKPEEALFAIEKSIEIASNIPDLPIHELYAFRGRIYIEQGDFEQAVADLDLALSLSQIFAAAYVYRAIANVSMLDKVTLETDYTKGSVMNQSMNLSWILKNRMPPKNHYYATNSAISDCNAAIFNAPDFAFAYYVRGKIKRLTGNNEYCSDLIKARDLGMEVEDELINRCTHQHR